MDNDQVGWSEAQWNRVREEVYRAWQGVRVAGSFLPVYGPLPSSTKVIPSEVFNNDGTIDDTATAVLVEISLPVVLTRQQVRDESLTSALLQFRRRANQVGQLEDWYIFNGLQPVEGYRARKKSHRARVPSKQFAPDTSYVKDLVDSEEEFVQGPPRPIVGGKIQVEGVRQRNPGALGLLYGARQRKSRVPLANQTLDNSGLMRTIVAAVNALEDDGYVGSHVCVFGRGPFQAAYEPDRASLVLPRDRLEPLIGRELLHASALDVLPRKIAGYRPPPAGQWTNRGLLLSLAGDAIDLAIAAEATAEFRQVDGQGSYVFSVFERFTLRIKDSKAIVPLQFQKP